MLLVCEFSTMEIIEITINYVYFLQLKLSYECKN